MACYPVAQAIAVFRLTKSGELEAGQLNTGSVSFEAKANDNTKTLSEVRLGSIAMINQGAEFIADEGLAAIQTVATNEGLATFGAMWAGTSEYETGSSVDLDSWNMVVGVASKVSDVTLAGFAEYGTGSSDAKVAQAKADGDHSYYGVGVAARWGETQGLFVDSAIPDFVSKVVIKTSSNACGYSICVAKFFSSHVAQK